MTKSNGLTITNLARRMAEIDKVHDDYDDRRYALNSAAGEDSEYAPHGLIAENYVRLTFEQISALEGMVATMPAESLADAGLQIAIAADWISRIDYADIDAPKVRHKARVVGRMLRSVLAVIAANCEPHEICRDGYRYTDLANPFMPPELPVPPVPPEIRLIEAAE